MRLVLSLFLLTTTLTIPPHALAQSTDTHTRSEQHFREGREAMNQGNFARALEELRKSHELEPGRGKLLNIAVCEDKLGQLASALAHFREVAAQLEPGDDRLPIAEQHIRHLEARVPYLHIRLAAVEPATIRVAVDGVPLPDALLRTAVPLNPGRHVITANAAGSAERRYDVVVEERKRATLTIEFAEQQAAPKTGTAPSDDRLATSTGAGKQSPIPRVYPNPKPRETTVVAPVQEQSFWKQHRGSVLTGGASVVLAGVGAGLSASILADHAELAELCSARHCTRDDVKPLEQKAIATNVAWGLAGAAAMTAGVMFLLKISGKSAAAKALPVKSGKLVFRFD